MGIRCLIVDDNQPFLCAARTLLEREGPTVSGVASTIDEALRQAATLRPPKAFDDLTSPEHDVLRLLTHGLSNAEIGQQLYISETTVKTHVTRVLQKLELRDRAQATVLAYRSGLVDGDES